MNTVTNAVKLHRDRLQIDSADTHDLAHFRGTNIVFAKWNAYGAGGALPEFPSEKVVVHGASWGEC